MKAPGSVVVVVAVLCIAVAASSCAECATDASCALTETCTDGVCRPTPPAGLRLVGPTDAVGEHFDVVVDATFDAEQATLTLARDGASPGEPCLPFLDRTVIVEGTAGPSTRRVTFADVPSLGASFSLRVTLAAEGTLPVERSFAIVGPPVAADVGGATILAPEGEIDVDATPLVPLAVTTAGPAVAWVEPEGAPALPRIVLSNGAADVDDVIALVRGPQVLWVETTSSTGPLRCGSAVRGLPAGDDAGALDMTMVSRADEPAWVSLSLRVARGDTVDICAIDADDGLQTCRAGRPSDGPGLVTFEQLQLLVDDGIVDVAVVPRVSVGPVHAFVRVTQAGRHRGFFGPFTFLPDEGQSWIAGQIVVASGVLVSQRSVDGVVVGAPW